MTPVLALLALQCTLCWTIKVPVEWNDKSEVQNEQFGDQQNETTIQTFTPPHSVERPTIPKEYFEYTAKKPQFATDISAFHGVKSPEQHYKSYPVRPYTSVKKPELGKHNIFDNEKPAFEPYRKFVKNNEHLGYVTPASSNYNIFHPYGAEEPALKAMYQDPVLDKIRNDLKDSQYRLQKYEKDAGESNIEKEEYLESPEQTDRYDDRSDGYDIYEKGKEKFTQLRNNVDESISNAANKNSPGTHKKLELQNIDKTEENTSDDYEFLPVKNYAQVRKIETVKHLPRTAAFEDAESYEDLKNAPRLKEAIKSTKAQTVYSEEGYEDSAYDHAGERKHASDHEGHGGYLKEKELSQGKYKIPTFSGSYEDEKGSSYRDKAYHGEKWNNDDKETESQKDEEEYSEDDQEYFNESDLNENTPRGESSHENEKVDYEPKNQIERTENQNSDSQHDLFKREVQNIKKIKEPVDHSPSNLPASPINEESDEEYEDYDEEEEDFPKTTTTTTTLKPQIRKKIRIMTTTSRPVNKDNLDKLRLVTRSRNPSTVDQSPTKKDKPRDVLDSKNKNTEEEELVASPKYREKKKKSSKSTLVTDSSSYGEGEDDTMRNKEVDELIGIQHDMEDYIPLYEKERQMINNNSISLKDKTGYLEKNKNKSEENEEEVDDVSSESEDDDNDKDENNDDDDDDDENNDDSEEDENNDEDVEDSEEEGDNIDNKDTFTTPVPLKGTLMKTTETPEITTKVHVTKSDVKPIISRKKIEIHKELPYQKSSPNVTQFKQDIKEIEIVKEIPPGKMMHNVSPQNDPEILQLYKDENLAKEVNGYFDVEVFKDDLDLKKSPRHGGNYRSIKAAKTNVHRNESPNVAKKDSISSPSQTKKLIEPTSERTSNHRSMRIRNPYQRSKKSRGQNMKPDSYSHRVEGAEEDQKSAKIIELSEDDDHRDVESEPENMHGGNFKTYSNSKSSGNPMHGGNYRSARIILSDKQDNQHSQNKMKERNEDTSKNVRKNSAALLDSFARAVPVLTTTPAYILDPSKRMYYYVDS
ncbi:unnamed protein product, partial [Iphiclides podalirius]